MSLLAVIPGLAPGLLALLPQLLLLLFALVLLLLSPRTWWRAFLYSVRRPQWVVALALVVAGSWYAFGAVSAGWPAPAAGKVLPGRVGAFSIGDSRDAVDPASRQGPARRAKVESYSLASPLGQGDLFTAERIFRLDDKTTSVSCHRLEDGELAWRRELRGKSLFPLVLVPRGASGGPLPGYLLALSSAGSTTDLSIIDEARGLLLSVARLEGVAKHPPVVVDELAVVACEDSLQAHSLLEPSTEGGAPAWKVPWAGDTRALAGDQGGHCLLLGDGLSAVDIDTGALVASASAELLDLPAGKPQLRVHQGLVFVFVESDEGAGGITCLEMVDRSFTRRWALSVRELLPGGFILQAGKLGYLTASSRGGGSLQLLDAATGRRLSLATYPTQPRALAADLSACYVTLADGGLSRFSHVRGLEEWRVSLGSTLARQGSRRPLLGDGKVLVAASREVFLLAEREPGVDVRGWTAARGGAGRRGNADQRLGPLRGKLLWSRELAGGSPGARLEPAAPLGRDIVTVEQSTEGSRLLWLDGEGQPRARLEPGGDVGDLVSNGERLFLSLVGEGPPGELLAVAASAEGLAVAWRRPLRGARASELCLVGDGCVAAGPGSLMMVDAADGQPVWERGDLGGASALCPSGRELALARGGVLLLVDAASGDTLRTLSGPGLEIGSIARSGRKLYVGSEGLLEAISLDTGEVLWSRRSAAGTRPELIAGEDCLVVPGAGELLSLAPVDGTRLSSFASLSGWMGLPALALGMAVAVGDRGLIAYDPVFGEELWRLEKSGMGTGQAVSSISIIDGRIYLRSAGELLCIGEGGAG